MVYQGLNDPSSKVYWFRIPKQLTLRCKNVIILFYLIHLFISGLENREYSCRGPSRWPCGTFYWQKLVLTSPIGGGRSVGIVRSQTQAMELSLVFSFIDLFI
jgi:hypothetical protein